MENTNIYCIYLKLVYSKQRLYTLEIMIIISLVNTVHKQY